MSFYLSCFEVKVCTLDRGQYIEKNIYIRIDNQGKAMCLDCLEPRVPSKRPHRREENMQIVMVSIGFTIKVVEIRNTV